MRNSPCAEVFFCDDVRREIGGKISVVGIYQGFMGIEEASALLPKLVALSFIDFPPDFEGKELLIKVRNRDQSIIDVKLVVPPPDAETAQAVLAHPGYEKRCRLTIPIEMIPFEPTNGMSLDVLITCGDFTFESQPLAILGNAFSSAAQAG